MSEALKRVGVGLAVFAFVAAQAYVYYWLEATSWEPPVWAVRALVGLAVLYAAYLFGGVVLEGARRGTIGAQSNPEPSDASTTSADLT
jgi:hypothetical protein